MSDMKFTSLLLGAVLLAACAKDELADDTRLPEGQYPLRIAAVTLGVEGGEARPWGAPQTRVGETDDGTGSLWDGDEEIGVQIAGSTEAATYTVRADSTVFSDAPLYWQNTRTATVTAWYPAADGAIDLGDQTNGLAYLLRGTGTGDYQIPVTLTFTHRLAKVRVTPSDDIADGEVTSLRLYTYTQCAHDQGDDVRGAREGWINMKKCEYTDNGATITCWEANVVPGYAITKLMANNDGKERPLSTTVNPEAGSFYNITLNNDKGYTHDGNGNYTVTTADGLKAVADIANNGSLDINITLDKDITLTGEWTPIGSRNSPYTGTFDGGGHILSGLTIDQSETTYVGLIGYIGGGGTVKNLTLADVDITADSYVGAVAGRNDGIIENCLVTGSVTSYAGENNGYVGGITGENRGAITGCAALGSVTVANGMYVGGIAGCHNGGSITVCYSSATVTAMAYVGGIAGQSSAMLNAATITACYSTGDVTAAKNGPGYSFVGGVVGYNSNKAVLAACYATGSVSGEGDFVGGVVGSNENGTLTACYHATGDVTGASGSTGGVVGRNYKDNSVSSIVTACYWNGTVTDDKGIGNDMVGNGETAKVDGSTVTWTHAMDAMNAALSGSGWQYMPGTDGAPLALQVEQ